MKKTLLGLLTATAFLAGCQTITEKLPTKATEPTLTIPIPFFPLSSPAPSPRPSPTAGSPSPAPTAAPTPAPTPAPTAAPTPTPPPSGGNGCGPPLPGPIGRVLAVVHIKGPNITTLDSTLLVGPDADYCRQVGFTDGRRFCPVRSEGNPERGPCEQLISGKAEDTGRYGPTWRREGALCDGVVCQNHPDNQYLLWAFKSGTYQACFQGVYCESVYVDR
jgi:hypothetical protein